VELLGTMQGGYNVAPLIDALDSPVLGPVAAKVLRGLPREGVRGGPAARTGRGLTGRAGGAHGAGPDGTRAAAPGA
jgi:hypothetical protein